MTTTRRPWVGVAAAVATIHLISAVGWVVGSLASRDASGVVRRPASYHGFLGWTSWDGGFYRWITDHGYGPANAEAVRFFPLYPMLARLVRPLVGGDTDLALFLVAKVSLVVALVLLVRLVPELGGTARLARRAVWALVLFPGAFVLAWAYSEPLLLALAIGAFLAMRRDRWWLAALLALAAGACRPVGVALSIAALLEARRARPGRTPTALAPRIATVLAAPAATVAFCWYAAARGFGFLAPITIQDELRGTRTPVEQLLSLPGTLFGADAFTDGLHVPFVVGFLVLTVVVFRRLPASAGWYTVAILVLALSAENLNSVERYATSAFPLVVAGAWSLERHPRLEPVVYPLAGGLAVGFCALAIRGSLVP